MKKVFNKFGRVFFNPGIVKGYITISFKALIKKYQRHRVNHKTSYERRRLQSHRLRKISLKMKGSLNSIKKLLAPY